MSSTLFFHFQLLKKTCQHLWLTLDPVLSSNAFFFLTISVFLDGFAFKCFFVARFCFSLLFKIILILGSWTSDAFTQCATNDEIFRGEIFWLHVVIHAPTREQALRWQIFHKEGFVNTEASFNKGLSIQKRKDDFQYFNQLFKTFLVSDVIHKKVIESVTFWSVIKIKKFLSFLFYYA